MSPSFIAFSGVPHSGHSAGITNSRSVPSRRSATGPRISGMTSPALRSTTVSPIRTPLAFTTSWLWRVANSTSEPATVTGSTWAYGVTRPVLPTPTLMSTSLVLTSSGAYFQAIAQRGARAVEPSRPWRGISSSLTTTPSISCSTE
ncbi:hypothetical protein STANM309S_02208 [Streptomyces tanashiensis]